MNTKKLSITLILLFACVITLYAQKGKVNSAANYKNEGKLDKAFEAIEEAVNPNNPKSEKSIPWARTWEVRGEIFKAIYTTKNKAYQKLSENPLDESYKSFMKAMELDIKGRNKGTLKTSLIFLSQDLTQAAIKAYESEDFVTATKYFENILAINSSPLFKEDIPVDTVIMYNTGIAAANAKLHEKAIDYFEKCITYDYNGGASYGQIISIYQEMGDTLKSVDKMKEGFERYPENQSILVTLINYYITTKQSEEAIDYLDKAIEKESNNPTFYFAKGVALDQLGRSEDALEAYKKATEVNPEFADSYYNIGVVYYNRGVNKLEEANNIPTSEQKRYEEEKAKADEEFKKAIPFMEKASELSPSDTYIMDHLKNLYYRLGMMDKFEAIQEKMNAE